MNVTTIPSARLRPSRIIPAALVALGLAAGATAAVRAIDDSSTVSRSPAAVSVPHAHPSFPLSANAAEHRAASQSQQVAGWTASNGLPSSPAVSELNDTTQSQTDTDVRFGPR